MINHVHILKFKGLFNETKGNRGEKRHKDYKYECSCGYKTNFCNRIKTFWPTDVVARFVSILSV